ncbi:MAG: dTDP-4-dehydrorhamnose reductase [Candidatus Neomarinimicrobiota bacterium]|nr:MAG: dTDP-4-dehydrorhamnose reductase [Candidatus Neomarinimicrobiota bacterium]
MSNPKVLITGAAGQLGRAVMTRFPKRYSCLGTDVANTRSGIVYMDITSRSSIQGVVNQFRPDVILNLAAMTHVDRCEEQPQLAQRINTEAVQNLLDCFSGYFIHISTDYVFDGRSGPYSEGDPTHPINVYGQTKCASEHIVLDSGNPALVVRTNVVFDYLPTQASFMTFVIDSLRQGKSIRIVDDQWNNPTWTVDLAAALERMLQQGHQGLIHYGGADYLDRYSFAHLIADVFDLNPALIHRIKTEDLHQPAPRPRKGGLKTDLFQKKFDCSPMELKTALEHIRRDTGS